MICIYHLFAVPLQRFSNYIHMEYISRIADILLKENLETFGATLLEGPKWCGKTTTARQQAASVLELQDPDSRDITLKNIMIKPSLVLDGAVPQLIDEWQVAPILWDAVRTMCDRRGLPGQFILTGSNAVNASQIMHTGTGRITRMKMYPMSLYESHDSNGCISLQELFDNPAKDIDGLRSSLTIEQLVFVACRGGWPAALSVAKPQNQLRIATDYVRTICETDISTIEGLDDQIGNPRKRDARTAKAILRSYARNISTLAKTNSILKDTLAQVDSLSDKTFSDYLYALQRLFIIEDIPAWNPAIRSASAIRNGVKRGMTDPSMAVAALGLSPEELLKDMQTFGFVFESLCFRDLKAYSQALGGQLSYYHDRYGLEADAVLHLHDGRYALIECKLGSQEIELGAEHLLEIQALTCKCQDCQMPLRQPDLLLILTGGQVAYTRPDGVKVIPIGCLKN